MLVHESWREEIGWFLIIFGVAGILFMGLSLLTEVGAEAGLLGDRRVGWLLMAAAVAVTAIGGYLHMTRPSTRQTRAMPHHDANVPQM